MRRGLHPLSVLCTTLSCATLVILASACDRDSDAPVATSRAARQTAPGRLLVVRFGAPRLEIIRNTPFRHVVRAPRGTLLGWKGRYEVQDRHGRVLATGRFRLDWRRHALFGNVNGPAEAVEVPVARPVTWLRVPTPPTAARVVLFDAGRQRLGEVSL